MSLSDTVDACPRLGVAAFSRSLMKRVSRNGCAIELTPDTVAKHISRALHEFTILTLGMGSPDARRDLEAAAMDREYPSNAVSEEEDQSVAAEGGAAGMEDGSSHREGQDAGLWDHDLLAACPACRGSQEYLLKIVESKIREGGLDVGEFEALLGGSHSFIHSMYIDGHFGLPHRASGGSSDHRPPISLKLLKTTRWKRSEGIQAA